MTAMISSNNTRSHQRALTMRSNLDHIQGQWSRLPKRNDQHRLSYCTTQRTTTGWQRTIQKFNSQRWWRWWVPNGRNSPKQNKNPTSRSSTKIKSNTSRTTSQVDNLKPQQRMTLRRKSRNQNCPINQRTMIWKVLAHWHPTQNENKKKIIRSKSLVIEISPQILLTVLQWRRIFIKML